MVDDRLTSLKRATQNAAPSVAFLGFFFCIVVAMFLVWMAWNVVQFYVVLAFQGVVSFMVTTLVFGGIGLYIARQYGLTIAKYTVGYLFITTELWARALSKPGTEPRLPDERPAAPSKPGLPAEPQGSPEPGVLDMLGKSVLFDAESKVYESKKKMTSERLGGREFERDEFRVEGQVDRMPKENRVEDAKLDTQLVEQEAQQAKYRKEEAKAQAETHRLKTPEAPEPTPEEVQKQAIEKIMHRVETEALTLQGMRELFQRRETEWSEQYGPELAKTMVEQLEQRIAQLLHRGL